AFERIAAVTWVPREQIGAVAAEVLIVARIVGRRVGNERIAGAVVAVFAESLIGAASAAADVVAGSAVHEGRVVAARARAVAVGGRERGGAGEGERGAGTGGEAAAAAVGRIDRGQIVGRGAVDGEDVGAVLTVVDHVFDLRQRRQGGEVGDVDGAAVGAGR